jgi:ABC-2 type transport system permease protein
MTAAALTVRRGPAHWWRSYLMMSRWEIVGLRLLLPITVFVQLVTGGGFVLGIGLFFDQIPAVAALYVSTGVVVITLATVGLVLGPQLIATQKAQGVYDFIWSLPVPRSTAAAAWITVNTIIAVPGMVVALLVATWRYDLSIVVSPAIIPGALLTLYTATMIGYAIAHVLKQPLIINLITQVTIFALTGFSPVNFPKEQMPAWLAALNEGLPLLHMANVMRAGLTEGIVTGIGRSYLVLGLWAAAATAVTGWVLRRRA